MSSFISTLVNIAANEIGVKEGKHKERINEYLSTTTIGPGDYAWCAAFVSWCIKKTLETYKPPEIKNYESWRCRSARVFDWEPWAKSRNLEIIYNCEKPARKGDLIIFDFSHIGIVGFDQLSIKDKIITIEGNTNKKGSRDGDGVYLKERSPSPETIHCFIRI